MSFMEPQVIGPCNWFEIDSKEGISFVPEDYFTLAQIIDMYDCDESDVTTKYGFGARMSAPGYLDCTEWTVFDTEREAEEYLKEYYGDEDEDVIYEVVVGNIGTVHTGDDLEDAKSVFNVYVEKSKNLEGSAANEAVTLFADREIEREYVPEGNDE